MGVLTHGSQCTSSVSVAELRYGARKRQSYELSEDIERIVAEVQVIPFDEAAAGLYAEIRVALEAAGRPLAYSDLQIAAICLARDLTLVTGNVRHFERVPGLRVENWLS